MRKVNLGNYYKAFDPNYIPHHTPFTDRQLRIIYGECDETVRKNEVSVILKKADAFKEDRITDIILDKYEALLFGEKYQCKYTIEEAKCRLQAMTPFKINWDIE